MRGSPRKSKTKAGFRKADMQAVSDNPAWTKATTVRWQSFDEVFPDLVRRVRGSQHRPRCGNSDHAVRIRLDQPMVYPQRPFATIKGLNDSALA
jgi:hypothetical protein